MNFLIYTLLSLLTFSLDGSSIEVVSNNDYQVNGTVLDQNGDPVSGLKVELFDPEGNVVVSDVTSDQGSYDLSYVSTNTEHDFKEPIKEFELGDAYPNPVSTNSGANKTRIPVRVAANSSYQIEVYTIHGRLITRSQHSLTQGSYTINVGLPKTAGVYLVRVRGDEMNEVRKVTSLAGNNVSIGVTQGVSTQTWGNQESKVKAKNEVYTLKISGGSKYEDHEEEISEPGNYTFDVTLQNTETSKLCSDITLASQSSKPGSFIKIEGLSQEFGQEPIGWLYNEGGVTTSGDSTKHPALIGRDLEALTDSILIPVHPENYMGGGNAELTIISEDELITCTGIDVEIEQLEPAPGTFSNMIDELEAGLIARGEAFGYTKEELMLSEISSLPEVIKPISRLLKQISDTDNPNSIRSVLNRDELSASSFEVMEAIFKSSGQAENFINFSKDFGQVENSPYQLSSKVQTKGKTSALDDFGSIQTPDRLDFWMRQHSKCQSFNDYRIGDVAGVTAAAIGFIPGGQSVGAFAGGVTVITQMVVDICEGQLPSNLDEISLVRNIREFNEDSEDKGAWFGELIATSDGYTLSLGGAIEMLPVGEVFSKFSRVYRGLDPEVGSLSGDFIEYVETLGEGLWDLPDGVNVIETEPIVWGPIPIDPNNEEHEEYFSWSFINEQSEFGDPPIIFDSEDKLNYQPNAVGSAELFVRSLEGVFEGNIAVPNNNPSIEVLEMTIEIHEDQIGKAPTRIDLDPSENNELFLEAIIENADDETADWSLEVDEGPKPLKFEKFGEDDRRLWLEVPAVESEEEEYSAWYVIKAVSTSSTGLREGKTPLEDYVIINIEKSDEEEENQEFELEPKPGCVNPDDEFLIAGYFGVEQLDINDLSVTLEGPGDLNSEGVYRASEEGQVTVTATYTDPETGEEYSDQINFMVMEDCGSMTVSSSEFNYNSLCVGGSYQDLVVRDVSNIGATFGFTPGADVILYINTDISEEGSWSRDFTWPDPNFPGEAQWGVPTFYDSSGDEWERAQVAELDTEESYTIFIERTEETFADQIIGRLSGEFSIPMYNLSEYQSDLENGNSNAEKEIILITGEFNNVPYIPGVGLCGGGNPSE